MASERLKYDAVERKEDWAFGQHLIPVFLKWNARRKQANGRCFEITAA